MKETFADWTAYDDWLIKNYNDFAVYKLDENEDHTITAEYRNKNGDAPKPAEEKK
jgi:hypothetical protein